MYRAGQDAAPTRHDLSARPRATQEVPQFILVMPDGDTGPDNDVVVARPRATQGEHDHPASPPEAAAARVLPTAPPGRPSSSGPAESSGPGSSEGTPPP